MNRAFTQGEPLPEGGDKLQKNPRDLVFRYGWRTVAVYLGGVFVLAVFVGVSDVWRLQKWSVPAVLVGFWAVVLASRFIAEMLNPRELKISGENLIILWDTKETTVPLSAVKLIDSGVLPTLLNYIKLDWTNGSILVFSHISGFKNFRKIISKFGKKSSGKGNTENQSQALGT